MCAEVDDDDIGMIDDDILEHQQGVEKAYQKSSKQWSSLTNSEDSVEFNLAQFWLHLQRAEGGLKQTAADADFVTNQIHRMMLTLGEKDDQRV